MGNMFWISALLVVCGIQGSLATLNDEHRLHRFLLSKYEDYVRPVENASETLKIRFGLALIQIQELNLESESMSTVSWLRYNWDDAQLKWDPAEYGGVDHTRIPPSKIWRPDLVLYNSVQYDTGFHVNSESLAVVSSDGNVLWIPPIILRSSCSMDLMYFPHDTQTCMLKFGSWTYSGFKVDIDFYDGLEQVDISDYIQNNEWELISHKGVKNVKYYPCCEEPYPDMTFTLKLKRHPSYLTAIFVLPIVLLCVFTPFIFLASHGSKQKLTLGAAIVISLMILIHMFQQLTATTRHTSMPVILMYYVATLFLVIFSLVLSILTGNLASVINANKHPPGFLSKIFIDCLGKICCVSRGEYDALDDLPVTMKQVSNEEGNSPGIKFSPDRKRKGDWYLIATVIDRLLFAIYLIVVILLIIVFSSA